MTVQAAPEGHSYLFPLRGASLYFVCVCVGGMVSWSLRTSSTHSCSNWFGGPAAQASQSRVDPRLWAEATPFLWSQTRGPVNLEPPAAISAPPGA